MYKTDLKHKNKSISLIAVLAMVIMVNACANSNIKSANTISQEVAANMAAPSKSDYPILYKIPEVPKDLMTDTEWDIFTKGLKSEQITFESKPKTQELAKSETDLKWADYNRALIENDAKSAAVPTFDGIAWAARMRAILNSQTNTTAQ